MNIGWRDKIRDIEKRVTVVRTQRFRVLKDPKTTCLTEEETDYRGSPVNQRCKEFRGPRSWTKGGRLSKLQNLDDNRGEGKKNRDTKTWKFFKKIRVKSP